MGMVFSKNGEWPGLVGTAGYPSLTGDTHAFLLFLTFKLVKSRSFCPTRPSALPLGAHCTRYSSGSQTLSIRQGAITYLAFLSQFPPFLTSSSPCHQDQPRSRIIPSLKITQTSQEEAKFLSIGYEECHAGLSSWA